MSKSILLADLENSLFKSGLPTRYVRRALDELSDHLDDIEADDNNMSRLGSAPELHIQIVTEFRQNSFAGRHPFYAVMIAVFAALAIWVICQTGLFIILSHVSISFNWSGYFLRTTNLALFIAQTIPFALGTYVTVRWLGVGGRRFIPVSAYIIQAILAFFFISGLETPIMQGETTSMFMGFSPLSDTSLISHGYRTQGAFIQLASTCVAGIFVVRMVFSRSRYKLSTLF